MPESTRAAFAEALTRENHTLKRALTDPRLLSGIGNAYSDEILHRARLSPMKLTSKLDDDETTRLWGAAREVLLEWTDRLRAEAGTRFPEKVTAFREGMAVHGRFRKPCPVCGTAVQRIVYARNECNYCPRCQTGGRVLADRSLSRLLKKRLAAADRGSGGGAEGGGVTRSRGGERAPGFRRRRGRRRSDPGAAESRDRRGDGPASQPRRVWTDCSM